MRNYGVLSNILLTSPEDREVQVLDEEVARGASLVCEPVDPETVFDPLVCESVDETVCEPTDPEILFEPVLVSRSTAKISGMRLPKIRLLVTT